MEWNSHYFLHILHQPNQINDALQEITIEAIRYSEYAPWGTVFSNFHGYLMHGDPPLVFTLVSFASPVQYIFSIIGRDHPRWVLTLASFLATSNPVYFLHYRIVGSSQMGFDFQNGCPTVSIYIFHNLKNREIQSNFFLSIIGYLDHPRWVLTLRMVGQLCRSIYFTTLKIEKYSPIYFLHYWLRSSQMSFDPDALATSSPVMLLLISNRGHSTNFKFKTAILF